MCTFSMDNGSPLLLCFQAQKLAALTLATVTVYVTRPTRTDTSRTKRIGGTAGVMIKQVVTTLKDEEGACCSQAK